jgi:hypothetical protein
MTFRTPSVLFFAKAVMVFPLILSKRGRGKERPCPAGCYTTARTKRTAQ